MQVDSETGQRQEILENPDQIYLDNIRNGKYKIKPRGENTAYVSAKLKSSTNTSTSSSIQFKNGNNASTTNGNSGNSNNTSSGNDQHNGPQSEGDIDELWLSIKEIQFVPETGNKTIITASLTTVDLLKLRTDATILFEKAIVPEGKYNQIRLILSDPNGKVVKEGTEYSLKVPSGSQTGIKLNGDIEFVSGLLLEFTLDFDLHSLKYTPGQGYILRPTIPIKDIKTLLPFRHGLLIVKFKNTVNFTANNEGLPQTGVSSVDGLLRKHNCIVATKYIDNFENMDMQVAAEVGLDRVYLLAFEQTQDVLLAMFDLNSDSNIEKASPAHTLEASQAVTIPNDPDANQNNGDQRAYLNAINAYQGWTLTTGSPDIQVAVVDTGIDENHPDLIGRNIIQTPSFYVDTCWFPFRYRENTFLYPYPCTRRGADSRPVGSDHGTYVAGILAASTNNGLGIAGINWQSPILASNVFQPGGRGANEIAIGGGIIEAVNRGARVINLSLGGYGYEYCLLSLCNFTSPTEFGAIQYADKKRGVVIAAAGNNKADINTFKGTLQNPAFYPASFPEVISVSALNTNGTAMWDWQPNAPCPANQPGCGSNWGKVEISAPGESILGTSFNDAQGNRTYTYNNPSGTSAAAPMVSAFASLILSMDGRLHPRNVLEAMCTSATQLTVHHDALENRKRVGCGRINMGATLRAIDSTAPRPTIINSGCGGANQSHCSAGRWFSEFSYQFRAEGGTLPYTWSYQNGSLPNNSSLNPTTGLLGNGPTNTSPDTVWTFDVVVTDKNGRTDTQKISFKNGW